MTPEQYRSIATKRPKRNKYGAKASYRCMACGSSAIYASACQSCNTAGQVRRFDSMAEARRYDELRVMQLAGGITDLRCQVDFPISVEGESIGKYVADFSYQRQGALVVEDIKGGKATDTALSKFKRKAVKAQYGITVTVVRR